MLGGGAEGLAGGQQQSVASEAKSSKRTKTRSKHQMKSSLFQPGLCVSRVYTYIHKCVFICVFVILQSPIFLMFLKYAYIQKRKRRKHLFARSHHDPSIDFVRTVVPLEFKILRVFTFDLAADQESELLLVPVRVGMRGSCRFPSCSTHMCQRFLCFSIQILF